MQISLGKVDLVLFTRSFGNVDIIYLYNISFFNLGFLRVTYNIFNMLFFRVCSRMDKK
jgi:hypothetical protein